VQEGILDQMPQLVQVPIVGPRYLAAALGWDDRLHALLVCLSQDRVCVVASVSQQVLGCKPFNQKASLRAIRCGTWRNNNSERQTMRIHGQV